MFNAEELRIGPLKYFKDEYIHLHPIVGFLAKHSGLIRNMRFFGNYEKGMLGEKREYAKDRTVESDPIWNIIRILYPSTSGELTTVANCVGNFGATITDSRPILDLIIYTTELRKTNNVILAKMLEKTALYKAGNPTREVYATIVKPLDAQIIDLRNVIHSTKSRFDSKYNKFEEMRVLLDCIFNLVTKRDKSEVHFGYPKFITEQLLLSYLWMHFDTIDAINLYMNGLPNEFFASQESPLHPNIMDIIEYCEEKNSRQGQTPYTSHPIENGNCYVYDRSKDEFLTTTFADCVENTIRHLVTLFLWNPTIRKYRKTDITAIDFFFDKLENANDGNINIRSRWNRVVCDLNNTTEFLMPPKDENIVRQILRNSKKWNIDEDDHEEENEEEENEEEEEDEEENGTSEEKLAPIIYTERTSGIEYNTVPELYNIAAIIIKIFGMYDRKIMKYMKQLHDAPEESIRTNNVCRLFEAIFAHISQNPNIKIKCIGEELNVKNNRCYGKIHVVYAIDPYETTKFILDSSEMHGRIDEFKDPNLRELTYDGEEYDSNLSEVFIPFFLEYSGVCMTIDSYFMAMSNKVMTDNTSYGSFLENLNDIMVTKTLCTSTKHVLVGITWDDRETLKEISSIIHSVYSSNAILRPIFEEYVKGYYCNNVEDEFSAFRNLKTLCVGGIERPDLSNFPHLTNIFYSYMKSIVIDSKNSSLETIESESCEDLSLHLETLDKLKNLRVRDIQQKVPSFIALRSNTRLQEIIICGRKGNIKSCTVDFDLRQCLELESFILYNVTIKSLIFGPVYTKLRDIRLFNIDDKHLKLDLSECINLAYLDFQNPVVIESVTIGHKNRELEHLCLSGQFDVYTDTIDFIKLSYLYIEHDGIFNYPLDINTKNYPDLCVLLIGKNTIINSLIMSSESKKIIEIVIYAVCAIDLDLRHYKELMWLRLGRNVKVNPLIVDHNHHDLSTIVIHAETTIDLNLQKCSNLENVMIGEKVILNSLILPETSRARFEGLDIRAKCTIGLDLSMNNELIKLHLGEQVTLTSLRLPSNNAAINHIYINSVGHINLKLYDYSKLMYIYLGEFLTGRVKFPNTCLKDIHIYGKIRIYANLSSNRLLKSISIGTKAHIHELCIGQSNDALESIDIRALGTIDLDLEHLHNLRKVILWGCKMTHSLIISSDNPSLETIDVRGIQVSVNRNALKNLKTFNVS